jgi:hypothetical protein
MTKKVTKSDIFTITALATRLGNLARAEANTEGDAADLIQDEIPALEQLIFMRPAANLTEAAIQLALVSFELADDWSHTDGDAVNREMRKLHRIVKSVFEQIQLEISGPVVDDILGGWCGEPVATFVAEA